MPKKDQDPQRLIRETAGRYRSADERFVVEQESPGSWYVADSLHTDDLGMPLLRGPFTTLDAAKKGAAEARESKAPAAPKRPPLTRTPDRKPERKTQSKREPEPPPKPKSWLETLGADDEREARRLIRTLERAGIDEPEELARRELDSKKPIVASELLAKALTARAGDDGLTPEAVLDVLMREGFDKDRGRPARGWRLVELDDRGRPTGRTIER
jgi:hypothetical protein